MPCLNAACCPPYPCHQCCMTFLKDEGQVDSVQMAFQGLEIGNNRAQVASLQSAFQDLDISQRQSGQHTNRLESTSSAYTTPPKNRTASYKSQFESLLQPAPSFGRKDHPQSYVSPSKAHRQQERESRRSGPYTSPRHPTFSSKSAHNNSPRSPTFSSTHRRSVSGPSSGGSISSSGEGSRALALSKFLVTPQHSLDPVGSPTLQCPYINPKTGVPCPKHSSRPRYWRILGHWESHVVAEVAAMSQSTLLIGKGTIITSEKQFLEYSKLLPFCDVCEEFLVPGGQMYTKEDIVMIRRDFTMLLCADCKTHQKPPLWIHNGAKTAARAIASLREEGYDV